MNVFVTHPCPALATKYLADRHVVKMTLETAQLLSTHAHVVGADTTDLYRPTHKNHPCRVGLDNDQYLRWVVVHGLLLACEYKARFGKDHKSAEVIGRAAIRLGYDPRLDMLKLVVGGSDGASDVFDFTDFPVCGPEPGDGPDIFTRYRAYLKRKYESWGDAARWTGTPRPDCM